MEETFDIVADINQRPEWDEVTQAAGIIERISPNTSIQYMRYTLLT
jgi:START domain